MRTLITKKLARTLLPEGQHFIAEFIGSNANRATPGLNLTLRKVMKNNDGQMISEFLDGPKKGDLIYLNWKNVRVEQEEGRHLVLIQVEDDKEEEFLKITPYANKPEEYLAEQLRKKL